MKDPVKNTLKRRLKNGEASLVLSLRLSRTVDVVGLLAAAGYHGFYVDLQHSTISLEDCGQLCTAGVYAGVTPLVRLPQLEPGIVARVMDGGAMGIVAPDIASAEEAAALVSWCRFPPHGVRSATGPLAMMGHRSAPVADVSRHVNSEMLVIVMIESEEALAQVDSIAAVEGVDALLIGSNDLTAAIGVPGEYRHSKIQMAYRNAIDAVNRHGKQLMIGGIGDPEIVHEYIAQGAAPCIFAGNDLAVLARELDRNAQRFLSGFSS